ncbi:MAG: divergent PAP2 family protein [Sphaerochaetaceae bacterium]|jgi:acid phosphatase family membrane protein YuiD|nr:divergent PAP2 family protein [Spirochaetaceae bacterium]MDY6342837.1 divergent PAP2 family protein [Sphaerochaetaceae bacterium]
MNNDVLHYTPFVTTLCSFLLAQLIKPFVAMVLSPHRFDYKRMFSTGGMPSSHTAGVITLCTTMGLTYGFASPYFVISGTFAGIVIHDAMTLRQNAGKQAAVINEWSSIFSQEWKNGQIVEEHLKTMLGHTWNQVLGGALFGLLIGLVGFNLMH